MKRLFYLLILTLTTGSCEKFEPNKDQLQVYTKDFKALKIEDNFEIVDIDKFENFLQLRTETGRLTCEKKISGLKFSFQNNEYYLTAYAECPTSNSVGCYFRMNSINIKNDSIIINSSKNIKIPIEELEIELGEIIKSPYNFQFNKEIMKPALIHLYIDEDQNISTTKKVLREIIDQFGEINSGKDPNFFEYHILFESFDRSNFPPPPPPPLPVEDI